MLRRMGQPLSEAQIIDRMRTLLADNFAIAGDKVTPEASFRGTLGMDSLDIVDFIFFLQDAFGLKAELEEYKDLHTVKAVAGFIAQRTSSAP